MSAPDIRPDFHFFISVQIGTGRECWVSDELQQAIFDISNICPGKREYTGDFITKWKKRSVKLVFVSN